MARIGDHDDVAHALALEEHADGERPAPALAHILAILELEDGPSGPGVGGAQHQIRARLERGGKANVGVHDLDGPWQRGAHDSLEDLGEQGRVVADGEEDDFVGRAWHGRRYSRSSVERVRDGAGENAMESSESHTRSSSKSPRFWGASEQ